MLLVEVNEQYLSEIKQSKRPQYAYIPGVAEHNLVADLDRVMTIEKSIVCQWKRISGCNNDKDIRLFQQALTRKRSRFAFPDDFTSFVNQDVFNRLMDLLYLLKISQQKIIPKAIDWI